MRAGTHTLGAADARGFTVREINLRDDRDSRTDLPAEVRFVGRFSIVTRARKSAGPGP